MTSAQRALLVSWLALATVCTVLMARYPGEETIPYHIAWFGIAVAYGYGPWPLRSTVAAVSSYTVASGGVLVWRTAQGVLEVEELAEIPLMCMLVTMMVLHVRRRHAALVALGEMADRERDRARMRERLSRLTSHEMRTPLTIAVGYVDQLLRSTHTEQQRDDLLVVRDELGRLTRGSERLLRMMQLQDQTWLEDVDLDRLVRQTAERWSAVAVRQWTVAADVGLFRCSEERIRACFDTLIENSLRYTDEGDHIRVFAQRSGHDVLLGVADSGPGLDERVASRISSGWTDGTGGGPLLADPRSQTGLGLGILREVAVSRGGGLLAGTAAEGGALVMVRLPLMSPQVTDGGTSPRGSTAGLPGGAAIGAVHAPPPASEVSPLLGW